jgi:hypothetical protein
MLNWGHLAAVLCHALIATLEALNSFWLVELLFSIIVELGHGLLLGDCLRILHVFDGDWLDLVLDQLGVSFWETLNFFGGFRLGLVIKAGSRHLKDQFN